LRLGDGLPTRVRAGWIRNSSSILSSAHSSRPALGPTYSPLQWINWTLSPDVKRQGHEADELYIHSLIRIRAVMLTSTASLNICFSKLRCGYVVFVHEARLFVASLPPTYNSILW
jgi:hypothetical protein